MDISSRIRKAKEQLDAHVREIMLVAGVELASFTGVVLHMLGIGPPISSIAAV